ncbi:MAG: histone-like protein [Candidatus Heimdallarchaeota archaeon]
MAKEKLLPPTTIKRITKELTEMRVAEDATNQIILYTMQYIKKLVKLGKSYAIVAKKKTITAEMIEQAHENLK